MLARYYTFAAGPARFFAIDTEGWSAAQLEWIKAALAACAERAGRALADRLRSPPHFLVRISCD